MIDPVKDPVPTSQYSKEEDPLLYVSKKTGRGPLTADWLQQPQKSIMCAYKRITVEFKYWGMQVNESLSNSQDVKQISLVQLMGTLGF